MGGMKADSHPDITGMLQRSIVISARMPNDTQNKHNWQLCAAQIMGEKVALST